MDRGTTTAVWFLLCVFTGEPAEGQTVLDVCATCHANATCDAKVDGSGKVCNCKYGFVGNGRTFCVDKDECQIGASRICGQHTTCHNTYGSYFCTCLSGYSPSNNMGVFIPNDGTHCMDIDECRITGVCGEGAQCRNLEGSFDCSCQVGYKVHDGAEPFNPERDRASCKVVDCGPPAPAEDTALRSVTRTTFGGVATFACDDGFVRRRGVDHAVCEADGQWRGLSIVCEEVDCGAPPVRPRSRALWNKSSRMGAEVVYECDPGYHNVGEGNVSVCTAAGRWEGPSVLCKEVLCGNPPLLESTEQEWDNNTTPGSMALYFCKKGFKHRGGNNVSICNDNGQWTPPTLSCQEILCGVPPLLPHTGQEWNGSSTPGSTLTYFCKAGFYHSDGGNVSVCTTNGYWSVPDILCKEVDCGTPPLLPDSVMTWDQSSTEGSQVVYQCIDGYVSVGGGNTSVCTSGGEWRGASLLCQEIDCGLPVVKPHANMRWDGSPRVGSVVFYQCDDGYRARSLRNYSVCGEKGLWEESDLWCEEISCGPPLTLPNTNLLWDRASTPGSTALYECVDGFYQETGNNNSTCSLSGEWGEVSVQCKAKCGPIPVLAKSEVVWHNRSVVLHRCVEGHHSWRGSNVSVCGSSGLWQEATLKCIEIKPPINHLSVFDEKCLRWEAEKYEEDTEMYKVVFTGSRDFHASFRDQRKRFVSSPADRLELCLSLLPLTNYSISVTAASARFTATTSANTSLPEPPVPAVQFREFESLLPTLRLRRRPDSLDAISSYQVVVVPVEGLKMFDCSSSASLSTFDKKRPPAGYIAAQLDLRHVGTEVEFTVGDGRLYGGFHNAPLQRGKTYFIILRAVSQWKTALKSSCVVWAKVTGTSYILRVSALVAAASVVLAVFIVMGIHGIIWCVKKT